jgi:hypothetical protein
VRDARSAGWAAQQLIQPDASNSMLFIMLPSM